MTNEEVLQKANEIAAPHGLQVEFLKGAYSVGVGGDCRTYTGVLVLIGLHPGNETLALVSTEIGNKTGVNRITFELEHIISAVP